MRYNQQLNISQRTNYAQQLLKAGNYKEAIKEFKAILDTLPQNTIAQNGLQSAQQAIKEKEIGSKYIVKRMDVFNSRRSDYCPMFLGNEINRLYFSSTRNEAMGDDTNGITGTKNGDIFVSERMIKVYGVSPNQWLVGSILHTTKELVAFLLTCEQCT